MNRHKSRVNIILITGGGGFIGSNLVDYLIMDGVKPSNIRVLLAPGEGSRNLLHPNLELIEGDIQNPVVANKICQGVKIIYHLASQNGYDGGDFDFFKATNLEATRNLIKVAVKQKVKKIIYFSSTAVYGLPATAGNIKNLSETDPKNPSEGYGLSKLMAEQAIVDASHRFGLKYIIIRPTTVYGPRDKGGLPQLINVIKRGQYVFIGNGQNKMDYVYVKDVVKIARNLEKSHINNQDFIVGSGMPVSQKEMVYLICHELNIAAPRIFLPTKLALLSSYIIKYLFIVFGQKPIIFPNRVKVLSSDFYFNTHKINRFPMLRPDYDFKKGVRETLGWLADNT